MATMEAAKEALNELADAFDRHAENLDNLKDKGGVDGMKVELLFDSIVTTSRKVRIQVATLSSIQTKNKV